MIRWACWRTTIVCIVGFKCWPHICFNEHPYYILKVTQTIEYRNGTPKALKTLYLNDWSHAYSSSKSPLAQRFAEEYDRRFYLGSKAKRGETSELKIFINNKEINWFRQKNQLDISWRTILIQDSKITAHFLGENWPTTTIVSGCADCSGFSKPRLCF